MNFTFMEPEMTLRRPGYNEPHRASLDYRFWCLGFCPTMSSHCAKIVEDLRLALDKQSQVSLVLSRKSLDNSPPEIMESCR